MTDIKIEVDIDVIRGKKLTDWSCFHITLGDVKKTIFVEYDTSSTLTSEGYEISWGTVYGHQEDPTYKDDVDIDFDSVEIDLGDGELVPHSLSDKEQKALNEYILCEYDFEDERIEAYENHINRD
jgi:hypothetical protein